MAYCRHGLTTRLDCAILFLVADVPPLGTEEWTVDSQTMRAIVRLSNTDRNGVIIGVTADADVYHLDCAIARYGADAISQVCFSESSGMSDAEILYHILQDTWPKGHLKPYDGIRAVMVGRDDDLIFGNAVDDSTPASCGRCLHTLAARLSGDDMRDIEARIFSKVWK